MNPTPIACLLIGLAGAIGTLMRWGVAVALRTRSLETAFPLGTLLVNVVGSFALGVVASTLADQKIFGVDARLVLGTGLLGGFTTYSAFNLEVLQMIERGAHARVLGYVCATLVLSGLGGALGLVLGRGIR